LKKILLIGGNYYPEQTGIGRYNGEMMTWLSENGFDCTVITTYPYYPRWKVQEHYRNKGLWFSNEQHGKVKVYRCPLYVPKKVSAVKRIMLDFSFSTSALVRIVPMMLSRQFDAVIVVVPPFHLGLLGVIYKKMKKARFIYHIQDLQIEAARDLNMIKSPKLINMLFKTENYILRHADVISSISSGMIRLIEEKAKKKVLFFPNWSDVKAVYPMEDTQGLKEKFGLTPDKKVVLYSGAIGEKQGLEVILEIAKEWLHRNDIVFVICGSGPYKGKLQEDATEHGLTNIKFLGLQPKERFNAFLNMADVHLVIQRADVSDLVMPSKLTNILAVGGLALVTANPQSTIHAEVTRYQMGLVVPAENKAALMDGIEEALLADNYTIRQNARRYAEEFLSIDKVLGRFVREAGLAESVQRPVQHAIPLLNPPSGG
jgi:colanic acid biosynthesis glycosyl transferase WcaI